jgi:ABC-2 type transport system ATP-binding protein
MDTIRIEGLTKKFPEQEKPALNQIDVLFPKGKRIGIVGPDGAGKTTLLRLLAGLLLPSEGKIEIFGVDAVAKAQDLHEMIGYMPQKFGLYEDLTIRENLELYASLQGVSKEDKESLFSKLLKFSSLEPFQKRLAGDLSGGMKQKLGLSCALMKKPRLLLLDEPTVGVDPVSRRDLWKMVSELLNEGITVLWSTSYLDEAEMCDEALLLYEGRVLFYGPPKDLSKRVSGRVFLAENLGNKKRAFLARLSVDPEIIDVTVQSKSLRLVFKEDSLKIRQEILDAGGFLEEAVPRFEDAFIDLLKSEINPKITFIESHKKEIDEEGILIEAKDLEKKFGSFTAVKNINFQVKSGEIFGLLGPNGAGKSTTFKMLCGLLRPTSGGAYVSGLSLEKAPSEARGKVGYMAQKFSLYSNMTVSQNLHFFAGIYPIPKDRKEEAIARMVEAFSLTPYLSKTTALLPLGFKQRLALACSLMHGPDVLFLDEPTAGVDPLTRREFWVQISRLVEQGMTVMVTTHFMDEAEYCDRIGLILDGKLMNLGTPDSLKELVRSKELPSPTLEDAFIALSTRSFS